MKTIKYICALIISCIVVVFCAFCPVFADSSYDTPEHFRGSTIEKKVVYKGALECYEQLAPTVALTSFGTGSTRECYATQGNTHYPVFTGRIGSILRDLNVGGSYAYRNCSSSSLRTWAKGIGKSNDVIPSKYDCESLLTSKVAVSAPNTTLNNSIEKERALEAIKYTSSNRQSADNHYCYSYPIEVNAVQTEVDPSSARRWNFMLHSRKLCTENSGGKVWTEGGDDYRLTPIENYAAENDAEEIFERNILQFKSGCLGSSTGDGIDNADDYKLCLKIDTGDYSYLFNHHEYVNIFVVGEPSPYSGTNMNVPELNFLKTVGDKFREKIGGVQQPGHTETITFNFSDRTEKYEVNIYNPCNSYEVDGNVLKCIDSDGHEIESERSVDPGTDTPSEETVYNKLATTTDANRSTIVKLFSGNQWNYNDSNNTNKRIKFTDEEIYELYTYYLENVYQISNLHCYSVAQNLPGLHRTKLWSDEQNGYSEYCYYDVSDEDAKVWGVDGDKFFGADVALSGRGSLEETLLNLQLSERPRGVIDENDEPIHPEEQFEGPDGCYAAGLENVAWIVCPALNNMVTAADWVDRNLEDLLAVDAEQFGNATHTAWSYFRNLANIVMILILIVIIASQVTGYGIDNYGIKKMLPKLIIMAVLINFSYFICELAVDLSNILGEGLNNLFQSIGRTAGIDQNAANIAIGRIVAVLFTAATALGGSAGTIVMISQLQGGGVMLVVVLFLTVLAALIAVLMFFLMLGGRMVVIILFVAISPLAFACYILPNTQQLFKKWWKIFQTMLIVYPICGALYGLSFVIRGIILSSNEWRWWQATVAILAPYLPFFALPALLKSAIGMLGAIGSSFANIGNSVRRGIQSGTSAIQSTAAYKDAQAEAYRNSQIKYHAKNATKLQKKADSGKTLGNRETRSMNRSQEFLRKIESENAEARAAFLTKDYSGLELSELGGLYARAYKYYDPSASNAREQREELTALSSVITKRDPKGGSAMIADIAAGRGGWSHIPVNQAALSVLRENMQTNSDLNSGIRSKTGSGYDFINGLGSVPGFSEEGIKTVFNKGDNSLHDASLARSLASGSLSSVKDWASSSKDEIRRASDFVKRYREDAEAIRERGKDKEVKLTDEERTLVGAVDGFDSIVKKMNDPNSRDQSVINATGDPVKAQLWKDAGVAREKQTSNTNGAAEEGQPFSVHNNPGVSEQPASTPPSQSAPKQQPKPGNGVPTISDPFVGDGTMDG